MGHIVRQRRITGFILAEHLAALTVTLFMVSWVVAVRQAYQSAVAPLRQAVSARYAANVALATLTTSGAMKVWVGQTQWQVEVDTTRVEVTAVGGTYHFTLARDDLD